MIFEYAVKHDGINYPAGADVPVGDKPKEEVKVEPKEEVKPQIKVIKKPNKKK